MATADSKRSRKPNFKQENYLSLVDEVEKNKTVILGKFSDTVSNERKKKLWNSIATKCSAIVEWSSQILKCKKSSNYNLKLWPF